MVGLRQQKKNLKKVKAKIEDMIPVITTRQAKKKEQMKTRANMAAGIAAGVAVGAVAGLLLAPKPGKETRQDIKKKAKEVSGAIKDKTTEVVDTVKEKSSKAASAVKHKLEKKTEPSVAASAAPTATAVPEEKPEETT